MSLLFFSFPIMWRFGQLAFVESLSWSHSDNPKYAHIQIWMQMTASLTAATSLWSPACIPPTRFIKESLWRRWKTPHHLARCPPPFTPPSLLRANSGCVFYKGKYIRPSRVASLDAWCPRRLSGGGGGSSFAARRNAEVLKCAQMLRLCVCFFILDVWVHANYFGCCYFCRLQHTCQLNSLLL